MEEDRSTGHRDFRFMEGPLFANVILADEINRTPPKTQAALLEAMQERQVTVGRQRHQLVRSVLCSCHAKPDRARGYLSAAGSAARSIHVQDLCQSIRALMKSSRLLRRTTGTDDAAEVQARCWMRRSEILRLQKLVRQVPVSDHVVRYALSLVRQTRVGSDGSSRFCRRIWLAGEPVHEPCSS